MSIFEITIDTTIQLIKYIHFIFADEMSIIVSRPRSREVNRYIIYIKQFQKILSINITEDIHCRPRYNFGKKLER